MTKHRLFSTDSPKAIKADAYGYLNAIHYLAPFTLGGAGNICVNASPACMALCLGWFSGRASMVRDLDHDTNQVRASRVAKTRAFMSDRRAYLLALADAITKLQTKATRKGKKLCVRLNGSSDIGWEGLRIDGRNLFELFPTVQFVDYTKIASRFARKLPANYHLTFSRSETNEAQALELLERGVNVAVVFAGEKPLTWHGYVVIDGDTHDLRHLDPRVGDAINGHSKSLGGYVVALSPKGPRARKDVSGFVVR
jgi:hypothetical protein